MTTSIVKLPFVAGLDTAGDPDSWDETGKFRRLENVRVELGAAGALVPRDTAQAIAFADVYKAQARIAAVEGKPCLTSESNLSIIDSAVAVRRVNTFDSAAIVSARPVEPVPEFQAATWGFASYGSAPSSDGDMAITHFVGSTTYRLISQHKYHGVYRDAITIASGANPPSAETKFWVHTTASLGFALYRRVGVDFVVQWFVPSGSNSWSGTVTIYATTFVPLDVQRATDGTTFCLGYDSVTGDTLLLRVNDAGTVLQTRTVDTSPNAPLYGALAMVANASGTGNSVCHAWTCAATGATNTIRTYRVDAVAGTVVAVGVAMAFPLSASAPQGLSAGGDTTGDESFCIAHYMPTNEQLVGSILRAFYNGVSITQSDRGVCPILPRGRLWVDSTLFSGIRVWGSRGTQCGLWQVQTTGTFQINPIGIHSSLRSGTQSAAGLAGFGHPRSIWISGAESKAMLPVDITTGTTSTCDLVHVAPDDSMGQTVAASGRTLLLSGTPRTWDGARFSPAGLSPAPFATLTPSAAGGSIAAGTYVYALVWEWTDTRGNRQQSAPTLYTIVHGAGSTNSVAIVVSTFHSPLDDRLADASQTMVLVVYRSTVGGTVCYRKPKALTLPVLDANALLLPTFASFTDIYADASWSSNETLYGQGGDGELPNIELEATLCAVGYGARMLGVLAAFPSQIWYSKEFRENRGLEFNPALIFACPGNVVALATQDGNVYAFGANDIWVFSPSFADNTGNGASPVDPVPVGQGIGCAWPQSVVATPVGIFFWGTRGCYLLQRGGGAPMYVGKGVEGIVAAGVAPFADVSGAAYNARTGEIAFTNPANTGVLVFNHYQGAWYLWRIAPSLSGTISFAGGTAVVENPADGRLVFAFLDRAVGASGVFLLNGLPALYDADVSGGAWECTIELGLAAFGDAAANCRLRTFTLDCSGASLANYYIEERDEDTSLRGAQTFACVDGPVGIYQIVVQKTQGTRFTIISPVASGVRASRFFGAELEVARAGRNQVRKELRKG